MQSSGFGSSACVDGGIYRWLRGGRSGQGSRGRGVKRGLRAALLSPAGSRGGCVVGVKFVPLRVLFQGVELGFAGVGRGVEGFAG